MIAVGVDVGKAMLEVAIHGEEKLQRFENTPAGVRRLMGLLKARAAQRIVVEPTGGYEEAVLDACAEAGLWVARINPRQARNFARATGQLAKTDGLDAHTLAEMAAVFHARLRQHAVAEPWQVELKSWLRRRNQVTEAISCTRQQMAMSLPAVRMLMKRTLAALQRERTAIDATLKRLLEQHATPALRSSKGMGPMFQAAALALLPELGQLNRQQLAKLVGVGRSITTAARAKANAKSMVVEARCAWRYTWPPFQPCVGSQICAPTTSSYGPEGKSRRSPWSHACASCSQSSTLGVGKKYAEPAQRRK